MQPLPLAVRRLWRSIALGQGVLLFIVLGIIELVIRDTVDPPYPALVVPIGAGLIVGTAGWFLATIRYRSWRFELTSEWIQARWGVLTHHTATIPRNRIQTLTSENGPIDRLLGLTSVTVHTAGAGAPDLSIPHLEDQTVEWLRGELARGSV
ncbi:MAG: PH domain-containing protein [Actinomycetia bacterium]|nr:PH domain-containing protein [Actinomycetes bacterium]MCP5031321.1 PH domain-containing protein [Actinomycetes bacterium]